MENDWMITPVSTWQDIEEKIPSLTASIAAIEHEISTINGVMTRSKSIKLETLKDKLYYDERMLIWYKKTREERIQQTKIIVDQLLDFLPLERLLDLFFLELERCSFNFLVKSSSTQLEFPRTCFYDT